MYVHIKRLFDILFSLIGLGLFFPLMALTGLLLLLLTRESPFFVQKRPGLHGKPFLLLKFRTMNNRRDREGQLLPDKERLTGLGRLIRKTSLDELPQLWNVLVGQMSIVGPRPLLMEYLPLYSEEQMRRHSVRPGITGWAQVNGRNAISWEKKFELDVWYVDHQSFLIDCRILFKTIGKVLKREGVSGRGQVTMEVFKGNF